MMYVALFDFFEVREALYGSLHLDFRGAFYDISEVVLPLARRQRDLALAGFGEHGGDEVFGAEHKLVFDFLETLVRELVFHVADDGFARLRGVPRELQNVRAELLVQVGELAADFHVFLGENPPRRDGELHHGHQRVRLAGTHYELFATVREFRRKS